MRRRHALTMLAGMPAALALPARAAPAAPGEPVSWPEVTLLDGTRWSGAQAQGRAVVVVFWSTSCPFCERHNAHLAKLHRAAAGLPLEIVTATRDRDAQAVRRYMASHRYAFRVTLDAAPLAAALSTRRMIPLTVTVDRQGRLKQVIPGEMFEDDVLELARLAT